MSDYTFRTAISRYRSRAEQVNALCFILGIKPQADPEKVYVGCDKWVTPESYARQKFGIKLLDVRSSNLFKAIKRLQVRVNAMAQQPSLFDE